MLYLGKYLHITFLLTFVVIVFITYLMRGDSYQLQGQTGADYITDTAAHAAQYRWILCVEPTIIASITSNITPNTAGVSTALSTKTLPTGFGFGADIRSITLTSGSVLAYKA